MRKGGAKDIYKCVKIRIEIGHECAHFHTLSTPTPSSSVIHFASDHYPMTTLNLPKFFLPYFRNADSNDTTSITSSITSSRSSFSWRTHRTSTAPSELLSFTRGAIGSTVGRALNRVGELALAPVENFAIRRELEQLREFLNNIRGVEEWEKVKAMLEDSRAVERIFEPTR